MVGANIGATSTLTNEEFTPLVVPCEFAISECVITGTCVRTIGFVTLDLDYIRHKYLRLVY